MESMRPSPQTKILDVGAEINPAGDKTLQLIDCYPWKDQITAANLSAEHVASIRAHYPHIQAVVADARALPWPDKHFDVVYSNAVIEHVGDLDDQQRMASEIMRVGKRWFVTTPNRWYPFEFHLRLPFVTWLPGQTYLACSRIVSYSHVQRKYVFGCRRSGIRLMTARELRSCFPHSAIIPVRVTFMAETLVVVGGD